MEYYTEKIEEETESALINELLRRNKPVVLKNMLKSWTSVPWTFEELSKQCGATVMKFRVVHVIQGESQNGTKHWNPKSHTEDPVWESEGDCVRTSLKNFIDWVKGTIPVPDENPFSIYAREDHWAYSSYNHMCNIFPENAPIMKGIDWSPFGFSGRDGSKSTFWIGSIGSNTPCHVDTYGCNLVAQLIGPKKWILFPPEDSSNMYLTRIPYEESSIYSQVNIEHPNLIEFPLFKNTHPHVVVLEPGDALFVPPKWWHYVAAKDTSVSVNTWIELEQDDDARLEEAVTKSLMSILIPACDIDKDEFCWLNPGEELVRPEDIEHLIKTALYKCLDNFVTIGSSDEDEDEDSEPESSDSKIHKNERHTDVHTTETKFSLSEDVKPVPEKTFHAYQEEICCCKNKTHGQEYTPKDPIHMKSIVNCIVNPNVVNVIAKNLKELRFDSLYVPPA